MSKPKIAEWSFSMKNYHFSVIENNWHGLKGSVFTEWGTVYVRTYTSAQLTYLRLIHNGRSYERQIFRAYTKRGLVTLAKRYIKEVKGVS